MRHAASEKKDGVVRWCAILILVLFMQPLSVAAKDTISWLEAVAPPFFIHDGPFQGQGYEDLITDILIEHMPDYEHKHMKATISRHYQQWKQGEKACSLAMFKTPERAEFVYFSIPSVFTLPPVLIINKEKYKEFGGQKIVSLKDILLSGKFVIGRSDNRSYGAEFDKVLDSYGNKENTFSFEGAELSSNLFKMLLAGRIDALPGLPEEGIYLAETMGLSDKIMTLSVQENQGNHSASLTYVACSKTEWGKKTIDAINKVLVKTRPSERYMKAYERWLDPSSIENYRKRYREVFLTIAE